MGCVQDLELVVRKLDDSEFRNVFDQNCFIRVKDESDSALRRSRSRSRSRSRCCSGCCRHWRLLPAADADAQRCCQGPQRKLQPQQKPLEVGWPHRCQARDGGRLPGEADRRGRAPLVQDAQQERQQESQPCGTQSFPQGLGWHSSLRPPAAAVLRARSVLFFDRVRV